MSVFDGESSSDLSDQDVSQDKDQHQGESELQESDLSGWSCDDEVDNFPRVALSSTSPSERSADISVTDADTDSSSAEREIIPKYKEVNGHYTYKEGLVDELLHRHFKDDDEISVSTIELDEFLTRHHWDLDEWFRISLRIPYVPAIDYISANVMKYLKLSLALQAHHLVVCQTFTFHVLLHAYKFKIGRASCRERV